MKVHRFDIASQAFKRDPGPTFAAMREAGPLIRLKLPMIGEVWLATTYEAVTTILRDKHRFVLEARHAGLKKLPWLRWWMPRGTLVLAKNMLTSDEPDHRRLRGLVEQAFLRQSIDDLRGRIGELADQFLDKLQIEASRGRGVVDLVEHFARPFPLAVICELLGLPEADRPRFSRWAGRLTHATTPLGLLIAISGIKKLLRYLRGQFRQCRRQPRPGLLSALVTAEHEGQKLSEDELLAMSFLLLFAGHETTVHLLSGSVLTLLQQTDQRQALQADWSQAETAVDELLRYFSPVQITKPRYAAEDMELFGQSIKRGEFILSLLASANVDPAMFDRSDELLLDRDPNPHVAFGTGIHVCLGLKLARAEGAIALERLFTRFPRLELACAEEQLRWNKRLGMRALTAMPVRLEPSV